MARPKLAAAEKLKPITLYLNAEERAWIEAQAVADNISVSSYLTELVLAAMKGGSAHRETPVKGGSAHRETPVKAVTHIAKPEKGRKKGGSAHRETQAPRAIAMRETQSPPNARAETHIAKPAPRAAWSQHSDPCRGCGGTRGRPWCNPHPLRNACSQCGADRGPWRRPASWPPAGTPAKWAACGRCHVSDDSEPPKVEGDLCRACTCIVAAEDAVAAAVAPAAITPPAELDI